VRSIVAQSREDNADVAGIIIEPISAFENRQATPLFYKHLRAFAQAEGIPFIVDETRVGMGITGKMWAHEHWYLSERDGGAPDIVTFGGRAGISGFYSTRDIGTASDDQNVNMVDILNYGVTWKSI
jgi:4-aminobutyrate aminotransferase/(S)-3-amino-2-methylpropionate transaminase